MISVLSDKGVHLTGAATCPIKSFLAIAGGVVGVQQAFGHSRSFICSLDARH